jgi:hypothetical protein
MATLNNFQVSYDVRKNDLHLATLTFVKPGYRLGESVLGVLDLGRCQASAGRILKVRTSVLYQYVSVSHWFCGSFALSSTQKKQFQNA